MQAQRFTARRNTLLATRTGMRTAVAAALAAGCVAAPGFAYADTIARAAPGQQAELNSQAEKQVAAAERAVAKRPQSAEARMRLGQAYLAAGRFVSAATTFEDATALGDREPGTGLGMALAYIGAGRNAEAAALLGHWRDSLPSGDYALAIALAGDPAQAIAVMADAIKQGENTPKLRQNLAYAYALSGRLAEARVIASQDVPVDQIDARISEWALQASIGSQQSRVAALLGAPVRGDPGQPVQIALAPSAAERPAFAVNDTPRAPAVDQELPALREEAFASRLAAAEEPQAAPAPEPVRVATAEPVAAPRLADSASVSRRFVSIPVVQDISAALMREAQRAEASPVRPVRSLARQAHASTQPSGPASVAPKRALAARSDSHVVQLGSFTSEQGARRAWDIFVSRDPSLKDHDLRITQATVNGRQYWRVAAVGFDAGSAQAKCSSIGRSRDCLALAADRRLPGAVAVVAQRIASR